MLKDQPQEFCAGDRPGFPLLCLAVLITKSHLVIPAGDNECNQGRFRYTPLSVEAFLLDQNQPILG